MKVKQLLSILSGLDDKEIVIKLSQSSIGPQAFSTIKSVDIGFDWDEGKVFLIPSKNLVDKQPETWYNNHKGKRG